jgi:hypothetical protein
MSIGARFIKENLSQIPEYFIGSIHEHWFNLKPQEKGKVGSAVVKHMLELEGYEVRDISNEGDLEYREPDCKNWKKCEVKASYTRITNHGEWCWWNQIRPKQRWTSVALVGVYPNFVKVWWKEKDDFNEDDYRPGHVTGNKMDKSLLEVKLIRNSQQDNFHTWDLVYEG